MTNLKALTQILLSCFICIFTCYSNAQDEPNKEESTQEEGWTKTPTNTTQKVEIKDMKDLDKYKDLIKSAMKKKNTPTGSPANAADFNLNPAEKKPVTKGQNKTEDGVRSEVDLKCLEHAQKEQEIQIDEKILIDMIAKCRSKTAKECVSYMQKSDATCISQAQSYYPFVVRSSLLVKITEACKTYLMKCPVTQPE